MPKTPFTHVVDKGSEGRAHLTRARPLDRGSSGPGRLWHEPGRTSVPNVLPDNARFADEAGR